MLASVRPFDDEKQPIYVMAFRACVVVIRESERRACATRIVEGILEVCSRDKGKGCLEERVKDRLQRSVSA